MIAPGLVRYVLTAAFRDRLFMALILMIVVGASLSLFLGSSAVAEKNQFAQVFTAAGLRFAAVVCLILFVVFHMRRAFDSRDIDFLLARPLSRAGFIMSHAVAFSIMALFISVFVFAAVYFTSFGKIQPGIFMWGATFAIEMVIVANAALFFSMVISSAAGSVMAVMGLYILGRLMGELLGIAEIPADMPGAEIMVFVMHGISLIVPRLDLMAQTTWLVYGTDETPVLLIIGQGVVYPLLLIGAATIDLVRKQF